MNYLSSYFRVSPERLFLDLCLIMSDIELLERLANTVSLDVCRLAKIMAEYHIAHDNTAYAAQLLALAQV